jgi:hypothetical protein
MGLWLARMRLLDNRLEMQKVYVKEHLLKQDFLKLWD